MHESLTRRAVIEPTREPSPVRGRSEASCTGQPPGPAPIAATGMSYRRPGRTDASRRRVLARLSLMLGTMLSVFTMVGCLVAPPPESGEPEKRRPELDLIGAIPSINGVHPLPFDPTPQTSISVKVRSEDAGEDLLAVFYLNWNVPSAERQLQPRKQIPASVWDDTERFITYTWSYGEESSGCKVLTMLVTHEDNWSRLSDRPIADSDVALASWTFNLGDDPNDPTTLRSCPTPAGGGV